MSSKSFVNDENRQNTGQPAFDKNNIERLIAGFAWLNAENQVFMLI